MDKDEIKKNIDTKEAVETAKVSADSNQPAPKDADKSPKKGQADRQNHFNNNRRNPRRGNREARVKPEFDQKIIDIRRVTRVSSGGRRFSFSVALVSGNRKGSVGIGLGKGGDTAIAIDKAARDAKKNMIKVPLTKNSSIPFEISAKYSSARVMLMPAKNRGVIAGGSVRAVLELAGIKDINSKLMSGSKNRLNNAKVTLMALSRLSKLAPTVMKAREAKK